MTPAPSTGLGSRPLSGLLQNGVVRACLLFGALAAAFWGLYLHPHRALFNDNHLRLFHPYAVFFRRSILDGHFPFWNPYLYSGVPFLADMQSALLYPATYLHLLFDFPSAVAVNMGLHAFLSGLFMFLLARDLELPPAASALAGIAYAFNGTFVLHYAFPSQFQSYVWLPVLIYCGCRFRRRPDAVWIVGGGAALSLQIFAGHPQFVLYTLAAALLWALWGPRRKEGLAWLAGVGAASAALAAAQWVPSFFLIGESPRFGGLGYAWSSTYSLSPREALRMLFPWTPDSLPSGSDPHIVGFYWGVPLLAVSLLGAVGPGRRRWLPFSAMALLGASLALGKYLPAHHFLYDHFLPLRLIRFPAQSLYLCCFGAALLAGRGLSLLPLRGRGAALVIALCAADLWLFGRRAVSTTEAAFYRERPPSVSVLEGPDMDRWRVMMSPKTRQHNWREGRDALEAWEKYKDSLLPNVAMTHGLRDADGYEELRFRDYDRILDEVDGAPSSPWLHALSVRHVTSMWELPAPGFRLRARTSLGIFENTRAIPRAHGVRSAMSMPRGEIIPHVRAHPDHRFDEEVILEGEAAPGEGRPFPVTLADEGPNRVVLSARPDGPGYVVLGDTFARGWSARVDGAEVELHRANFFQRAVRVPGGESLVEFDYLPPAFPWCAAVSLAAWGLGLGIILRRRSQGGERRQDVRG